METHSSLLVEKSMDRGAWQAIVLAVLKRQTGLSRLTRIPPVPPVFIPPFCPPPEKKEIEKMSNIVALCVSHDELTQRLGSCFAGIREL